MTTDEKLKLITRNLEEVLTEDELIKLIESNTPLKHYIGFEISGKVHLGTGFATMLKIKDLQEAGVQTTILLADWHTWLNKKLDGTLETARKMAREYFEEGLKAAALCVGADPNKIEFVLGSELYEKLGSEYWASVVKVSKATTLPRMLRSTTIMGRQATEVSDAAMLIYPSMQSADIYALGVNIAHAGTDQRNVHVVARDAAKDLNEQKPIAIHHHLLLGLSSVTEEMEAILKATEDVKHKDTRELLVESLKMSKSKPDSAVFIHDSPDQIQRKINNAFAPEGDINFNPILDWTKHLVLVMSSAFAIHRKKEHGGDVEYKAYGDLEKDYAEKKLHPQDLKNSLAEWLIQKLEPARIYFEDPKRRSALEEIERLTIR